MDTFYFNRILSSIPLMDQFTDWVTGRSRIGSRVLLSSFAHKQAFEKRLRRVGVNSSRLLLGSDKKGKAILVPIGKPLCVSGPAGTPKGTLLKLFAFQYASLGFPVLFLDCEGYESESRRLHSMTRGLGCSWFDLQIEETSHSGQFGPRFFAQGKPFEPSSINPDSPFVANWQPQTGSWERCAGAIESLTSALLAMLESRAKILQKESLFLPTMLVVLSGSVGLDYIVGSGVIAKLESLAHAADVRFIYEGEYDPLKMNGKAENHQRRYCLLGHECHSDLDEELRQVVSDLPLGHAVLIGSNNNGRVVAQPAKIPYPVL